MLKLLLAFIALIEIKSSFLTQTFVDKPPQGSASLRVTYVRDAGECQDYPLHFQDLLQLRINDRLRGGGSKRIKKLTPEQKAYVDRIKFPPDLEKDLRRHWKKKPEILEVPQDGKIVKVRTSWVLQRIKERALERQKKLESFPMRLLDLGTKGVRWIRDIPGQILAPLFSKKAVTTRYIQPHQPPLASPPH
jgi:hypothetical protein